MATVTLGSKGLLNANLELVQGQSFSCSFIHEDEDGNPIDHTGWTTKCSMQRKVGGEYVNLDDCVWLGDGDGCINVTIPDDLTVDLTPTTYDWDLFAEDATGYATRIAYGVAKVYDSVARDG